MCKALGTVQELIWPGTLRIEMHGFHSALLKDRHIVVTGGGTGLGRVMAVTLASLGARVTVNGRREEPLAETVDEIASSGGVAGYFPCNVRDAEAVAEFFNKSEEKWGGVDGLVNNAAANFLARSETLSSNALDAVIRTNLYGSFYATQQLAERCFRRGTAGSVVSIVTTYAETGSAFVVPSAMSKAAIVAMTRSLAVEWGNRGLRLNAVAPGPFPTDGAWSRLVPDSANEKAMLRRIPSRRFGDPKELADIVAFLLSDLAAYINGAVITADAGEAIASGGQFNDLTRLDPGLVDSMFERMRGKK
jgi:NAD(P)-dependent dehydrogenase (short-subunit alcohol dehydrogenase family)